MRTAKYFSKSNDDSVFRLFGELAASLGIWVWEIDTEGVHTYSNDAVKDILGYTSEEIVGKHITELWIEDDRTKGNHRWLKKALVSGRGWKNFLIKLKHKDGSEIAIESSAFPVLNRAGKLGGYRGIDRDITSRWKMALEVQRERDKLREYLDIASVMISVVDENGNIVLINRKGCETLGYNSKSEIIGKNIFYLAVPQDIRKDLISNFKKSLAGEKEFMEYYECPIIARDGKRKLISWRQTLLKDENGKVLGILGSGEDITERKETFEALRQSEQKYATLVENSNDGIIIIQDRVLKFANKKAVEFFGVSEKKLVGKVFTELVPEEYRKMLTERYEKRISGAKVPKQYEIEIERRGKRIPVSITGIRIIYNGRPASMVIIHDLRDRKRVEELLRRDKSKLEEIVRKRTAELRRANAKLAMEVKARKQREKELIKYQEELERKTKQIEEKNIALKEVLASVSEEKLRVKREIAKDIEQEIIPIVLRLKGLVPETGKILVDLLEDSLNELTGAPGSLMPLYSRLSRREIEICSLIRNGLTTKEIARQLNIAITTVQKHRQIIRKKLNITNKGVNLETYLNNIR